MLNDLTTGQKVQIGFIALVLCVAAYTIYASTKTPLDSNVNCWALPVRKYPVDMSKPFNAASNPYDPKKEVTPYLFISYDGKLEIREYRNDPDRRAEIVWSYVEPRRKSYLYYHDPMEPVKAIKDPYQHAIALAAYSSANKRPQGLLGSAGMSAEQLTQEKAARDAMNNSLALFEVTLESGHFNDALMEKLMTALNQCRRNQKDATKDPEKAELVRRVLETASAYLAAVEAEKVKIINKYIDKVSDVLTSEQKTKVAEAGKALEGRLTRFAVGGPGAGQPASGGGRRPGAVQANGAAPRLNATTKPGNRGRTPATAPAKTK